MEPYIPPTRRKKNPSPPPPGATRMPNPAPAPTPNPSNGEDESWMTKHPLIFLAVSGLITASIGAVATHYIGRALQKREARGRLEGELAEAEALGEEPVRANPEEAELGFDDWMTNMEQRLINLSAHMGVKE